MRGKAVFYPVGWDDNGLATERRVQNYYGVRCEPAFPYEPGFAPPARGASRSRPQDQLPVSRRNFLELCRELTALDEAAYARAWQRLGLSMDAELSYRTIDARAQRIAQLAFLRAVRRGDAYQAQAPALWDVTYQTAVAQAEIEDRQVDGEFIRIGFPLAGGGEAVVATTRPELLPACVALVAHPQDERYRPLFGATAAAPLFGATFPILAHHLADPSKGTGLVMVCTFGDMTDVVWWRDLQLGTRPILAPDGTLLPGTPEWITTAEGQAAYARIAGLPPVAARRALTAMLGERGLLRGEPERVRHAVKFYEYGQAPLEIITTRQWYIRNGARSPDLAAALLARGRELDWHPEHMRSRYEHWVAGLTGDWLVSRQRYNGVPIPVWYPVGTDGVVDRDRPILPAPDADLPPGAGLPVDPAVSTPAGYRAEQRGQPGGFAADQDVMDTWATSSLTPQIAAGWPDDQDLLERVFPMDLRPQAHEIIRTWLFYTVLRSHAEAGVLPWRHAAISGWILDPDRKKMSKSKGNAVTPMDLLREHGSDAVRYWAASARLGVDTAFDVAQIRVGRRLAIKILNAARFVLGLGPAAVTGAGPGNGPAEGAGPGAPPTAPLDRAMLSRLASVVAQCTSALESYDHAAALEQAERFFWFFCDDYLELVKARAYGEHGESGASSARAALRLGLSVLLRLFAPFLPFVTEEVWSWWQDGSIHVPDSGTPRWPDAAELAGIAGTGGEATLTAATTALGAIRRAKSAGQVPMRTVVPLLVARASQAELDALAAAGDDLRSAGKVAAIDLRVAADASEPAFDVVLGDGAARTHTSEAQRLSGRRPPA